MEQIYAVCQALMVRLVVNFVEEAETLMEDLREIGPHFVLLAPRAWESLAADVQARMMDASPFKRWIYQFCVRRAIASFKQSGQPSKLAYWLIFKPLKDRLGFSHLRSAATGGAALGPDTFKFFLSMGVPLRQIYGQTELAGAYTIHAADDVDFDSVGIPFKGSDVRIDNPDENGVGEIIARNPGMFSGYYKNEEATRESVDAEGWMATGDAGYFKPENGHLVVIDRISDIAVTDCGARFSPQFIENKLKFSPFIAEVVVLGHQRPFLTAMICIRFDMVSKWAEKRNISFTNYINLSAQDAVYERVQREVEAVNKTLPEVHRIQKFLLLYKQLDADDGELTRTRKVRRGVIREVYSDIISGLYSDNLSIPVDTTITFQDGNTSRVKTSLRVVDLVGTKDKDVA
jgi:long-chain acyl-CoA synthetase